MKKSIQTKITATCFTLITGTATAQKVVDPDADPAIERETKAFLHALNNSGGTPMESLSATDARRVLEGAQKSVVTDVSGIHVEEKDITQDGIAVKIYIIRPEDARGNLPVFMFFHGGGWVLGDFETHKRFVRDLVVHSGAAAVFVEYSRSPEVKFPIAINQAYAATKWVAEQGMKFGLDGQNLAIAGNSAGGNITAAVALLAMDRKGPKIKFQVLFWPVTDYNFDTGSYLQFASSRFLTRNMMIWFWDNYLDKATDGASKYASPLRATIDELRDLPPALIQTAENDVLRDEGEAYARKLNEAGVAVSLVRMQGMIHDYGLLNPLANLPEVQSALRYAAHEIAYALKPENKHVVNR